MHRRVPAYYFVGRCHFNYRGQVVDCDLGLCRVVVLNKDAVVLGQYSATAVRRAQAVQIGQAKANLSRYLLFDRLLDWLLIRVEISNPGRCRPHMNRFLKGFTNHEFLGMNYRCHNLTALLNNHIPPSRLYFLRTVDLHRTLQFLYRCRLAVIVSLRQLAL